MRVINPRQREQLKPIKRRSKKPFLFITAVFLIISLIFLLKPVKSPDPPQNTQTSISNQIPESKKKGILKTFTGQQFKELYDNFAYPNSALINEHTLITGNQAADDRIRAIAVQRGYKLRSAPVTNTFQDVGQGYRLQQRAAQPWLDLKNAAKKDGLNFGLTAAYRSAEEQKQIFLSKLYKSSIPVNAIASGAYDAQISEVLRVSAIPGYSRHHTGYTVDISCQDQPTIAFENTKCFAWLQAENYKNAKNHGWIPSYPDGAANQGPDPETWEYVWVGKDALTE